MQKLNIENVVKLVFNGNLKLVRGFPFDIVSCQIIFVVAFDVFLSLSLCMLVASSFEKIQSIND